MQLPFTAEEILHFIPLAIGYAIILILFLRSRREVKRSRGPAEAAHSAVPDLASEGQGSPAPVPALTRPRVGLAERAELLRTYRRAESALRISAALAAGQRR
ncbi:MAG TPA: hypothetical protein VKF41_03045 [Bryobacteraceae bacterium]|nr:hypothetical protein [Bryobacteraceae bacterium]